MTGTTLRFLAVYIAGRRRVPVSILVLRETGSGLAAEADLCHVQRYPPEPEERKPSTL
jgi:hypothetical protein